MNSWFSSLSRSRSSDKPAEQGSPHTSKTEVISSGTATIDQLPYTYTGLLDDVMIRWAGDGHEASLEAFFRKIIAKNVFFGGGILFNDGYLVNHPVSRKHLQDENDILRTMINANFVRVLTREPSAELLSEMPIKMAKQGNTEYGKLVNSSEWDDFHPNFKKLSVNLFRNGNALPWPKTDMSSGFTEVIKAFFENKHAVDKHGLSVFRPDDIALVEDYFSEFSLEKEIHATSSRKRL